MSELNLCHRWRMSHIQGDVLLSQSCPPALIKILRPLCGSAVPEL